jgi:trehalose-phosphatase
MRDLNSAEKEIGKKIKGRDVCLFLDFDGTLTPIRRHPRAVKLSGALKKTLRKIAALKGATVAVISGRSLADVKERVGIKGIIYAGNHGMEAKGRGINYKVPGAVKAEKTVRELSRKLKNRYRAFRGVIVEDKGLTLSVHFRMVPRTRLKAAERIFREVAGPYISEGKVRLTRGKKVWEVRPPVRWDKGKAVARLLSERKKKTRTRPVPFYLGDDRTDEDAFRALRGKGYTVKIGKKGAKSRAGYYLKNTTEVRRFLERLSSLIRGEDKDV